MSERATVDYIKDAKVSDRIWVHEGLDLYRLFTVTSIGRKYFTAHFDKDHIKSWNGKRFEIGTGRSRAVEGWTSPDKAFGELEMWSKRHRHKLVTMVESADIAALVKFAKAIGYEPGPSTGRE